MIIGVFKHALMITSFVLIMMLLIEYINVQTRGSWQQSLKKTRIGQYILGAVMGVIPGCLGAFTVVSLYSHRTVSFGALVAAMIATSGDEAFVMLSMFPLQALWLSGILFIVAIAAGWMTDKLFPKQERFLSSDVHELEVFMHPMSAEDINLVFNLSLNYFVHVPKYLFRERYHAVIASCYLIPN